MAPLSLPLKPNPLLNQAPFNVLNGLANPISPSLKAKNALLQGGSRVVPALDAMALGECECLVSLLPPAPSVFFFLFSFLVSYIV